jgi:hypothetical protein
LGKVHLPPKKPMLPSNHKIREQKPRKSIENILSSASAQGQENFSLSSHNSHAKLCKQLLPKVKGWEATFVRQLLSRKAISCIQEEKLRAIMARHLTERRICRYCGRNARTIDKFNYYCPICGNCINYFWHEGGES